MNSFAGEFLSLLGAFRSSTVFGILGTAVVIPAAWYMLLFFQGITWGATQRVGPVAAALRKGTLGDMSLGEFLPLLPLLILIFYIGLQPAPLTSILEPSVFNALQSLGNAFIK